MSCQQGALYAAERTVPTGRAFQTQRDMQAFVDSLRESEWWERNFPRVRRIEAYFRGSGTSSVGAWRPDANAGVIEMLPSHRNKLIVLHEVCHVLAAARFDSHSHDPWFARLYLEAVYTFMGSDTYAKLRAAFEAHGIDCDTDNTNPAGRIV